MKSIAIILGLLLMGICPAAFGQSAGVNTVKSPYPGLGNRFTQRTLSPSQREAFDQRAMQKLRDLGDYLSLAGSASYDGQMRKKAVGMALDLFVRENESFPMILPDCRKASLAPIDEYLHLLVISRQNQTLEATVTDIVLVEPSTESDDGTYRGRVGFTLQVDFRNDETSKCKRKFSGEIEFSLLRVDKKFGDKVKTVWETKLGGVK